MESVLELGAPDVLSLAFRVVSFVLLLNAAGVAIFVAVFGHYSACDLTAMRRSGCRLAIAALVLVTGHQLLEAARMAGELSGLLDPAMQRTALHTPGGAAFAVRVTGLVLIAAGLGWRRQSSRPPGVGPTRRSPSRRDRRTGQSAPHLRSDGQGSRSQALRFGSGATALLGSSLAITSFTLMGHTSTLAHSAAASGLLLLHLLIVSFWIGALWPLYFAARSQTAATGAHAARRETVPAGAQLIAAFSRSAAWLVPLILVAGAGLTALLIPDLSALRRPYGQLLLAKVALFAVLMGCAALNKWQFGPACAAGDTRAFRRTVIVEYVLICVVLAVTAAMTTFFSPAEP